MIKIVAHLFPIICSICWQALRKPVVPKHLRIQQDGMLPKSWTLAMDLSLTLIQQQRAFQICPDQLTNLYVFPWNKTRWFKDRQALPQHGNDETSRHSVCPWWIGGTVWVIWYIVFPKSCLFWEWSLLGIHDLFWGQCHFAWSIYSLKFKLNHITSRGLMIDQQLTGNFISRNAAVPRLGFFSQTRNLW